MPKELNLNQQTEVLVVKIGEKTYKVPFASSLPYKKAKELSKIAKTDKEDAMDVFLNFFADYIPSEVLDELPVSALNELAKAWSGKSEDGETLGE